MLSIRSFLRAFAWRVLKWSLPTRHASLGASAIELAPLMQADALSYDPGFSRTAVCTSHITYVDGQKGLLLYRGYSIAQLAEKSDFLEVAYLLIYGELPNLQQKQAFTQTIQTESLLPKGMVQALKGFQPHVHPMARMIGLMSALSADYCNNTFKIQKAEDRRQMILKLLGQIPLLAALSYQTDSPEAMLQLTPSVDYTGDFLRRLFCSMQFKDEQINATLVRALDRIFILHADHEQSASTTAVRLTGATGANICACLTAGLATLWGPMHGGANEACLRMLIEIGDSSRIMHYINRAKDRQDPFRLMGFGHRLYKTVDPRAAIMRKTCHEVLQALDATQEPLFKLALSLEKIALEDEYFVNRKLYPNVDFYSGIILSALRIPIELFTVIFAVARTIGWAAHWLEMMADPERTLGRPRQLYIGFKKRDYPTTV
jgi:citrate synthase